LIKPTIKRIKRAIGRETANRVMLEAATKVLCCCLQSSKGWDHVALVDESSTCIEPPTEACREGAGPTEDNRIIVYMPRGLQQCVAEQGEQGERVIHITYEFRLRGEVA
tara:strand:+ start:230 stop:556 length:327 start_codon:yes stop_codon:yes gene_type:complete